MALEYNPTFLPPDKGMVEVVERKGLGHPDTLVDGIAEFSAVNYAQYCLQEFGAIPHHNLDKAMLLGGLCLQKFGGDNFRAPLNMLFMGRASRSFGDRTIPLSEIQDSSARDYLRRVMPHLDTEDPRTYISSSMTSNHSTRPHWFAPRSVDDLPEYITEEPLANDTATMISYWPLTDTERLALNLEGYFYRTDDNGMPVPRFEYIGQDIKVMCVRKGSHIDVTMAVPQIATLTPDMDTYLERRETLEQALQAYAEASLETDGSVKVNMTTEGNTGKPRLYMVTGGSCTDFGEEGAVGRGNKTHGIISSFRPNTMEAPHGKNPTYFVGKLLGYQADLIARSVYEQLGTRCQVVLQANFGDKLFDPSQISVSTEDEVSKDAVQEVVSDCLSLKKATTNRILDELYFVPRTNTYQEALVDARA
jgi:S-adenosylmethionine synthetase